MATIHCGGLITNAGTDGGCRRNQHLLGYFSKPVLRNLVETDRSVGRDPYSNRVRPISNTQPLCFTDA